MRVRVSRRVGWGLGAAGERARDSRKGDLSVICHMCVQTVEQLKFKSEFSSGHSSSQSFHCSVEFQNEIPVVRGPPRAGRKVRLYKQNKETELEAS